MDFKDSKSLKEFDNDNLYDALCKGLNHPDDISHLKDLFKDTTTLHYHLFDDPAFTEKKNKTEDLDPEMLELELIDAGCEEIDIEENSIVVYGDYTAFGTLSKALEDLNLEVQKSSLKRIPTSPVDFSEEQLIDIEKMLDKIEDDDDIQQVFTNIA